MELRSPMPGWVDISKPEIRHRVSRASKAMEAHNLDALFLTRFVNVYYMCGLMNTPFQHTIDWPYALIVKRDGDMSLVIRGGMTNTAELASFVPTITEYRKIEDGKEAIQKALRKAGLERKRVGAELGEVQAVQFSTGVFMDLAKESGVEFVDGSQAIWDLRTVKSEEEIGHMRVAGRAASRASDRAFAKMKVGMTEREFARTLCQYMIEEGADRPAWSGTIFSGEKVRRGVFAIFPTDKKFRQGDFVCADFGAISRHYWSDLHRVGYVGSRVPQREKEFFDVYMQSNKKGTKAVRPGVTLHDVYQAIAAPFLEAGYAFPWVRAGHGVGLDGHEPPHLMKNQVQEVVRGMVFSIEPFGVPNEHGVIFNCEDNVACTDGGYERLSTPQNEIYTI